MREEMKTRTNTCVLGDSNLPPMLKNSVATKIGAKVRAALSV
jgi:hypothetical protein